MKGKPDKQECSGADTFKIKLLTPHWPTSPLENDIRGHSFFGPVLRKFSTEAIFSPTNRPFLY
jgi:hypothetical protein